MKMEWMGRVIDRSYQREELMSQKKNKHNKNNHTLTIKENLFN